MSLTTLDLKQPARDAADLQPALRRLLAVAGDVLPALEDSRERDSLCARLGECRSALDARTADAPVLISSCFELCERALSALGEQQAAQRAELRKQVSMFRDTLALLVGGEQAFSQDVVVAARRFQALLEIPEVGQLKRRLSAEIGELQRLAAERQTEWQRSADLFTARITALEEQVAVLSRDASEDALTGLANRRHFEQIVRRALTTTSQQLVVAAFDLDGFKQINDTAGHGAGDAVLRGVAGSLEAGVRKNDLAARFGGDEFALALFGCTLREAEPRLLTIQKTLCALPTGIDSPATVSVSCGATEYCAGDTFESLLHRADQALYSAKRQGKRRLVVQSPAFIRDLLRRPR